MNTSFNDLFFTNVAKVIYGTLVAFFVLMPIGSHAQVPLCRPTEIAFNAMLKNGFTQLFTYTVKDTKNEYVTGFISKSGKSIIVTVTDDETGRTCIASIGENFRRKSDAV
jgi:hypothetical protein